MEMIEDCPTCSRPLIEDTDKCTHCGQEFCLACLEPIDNDDQFCRQCGIELNIKCSDYGTRVRPGAILCPKCGLLLKDLRSTPVPEYTRFRTETSADEEAFTGICPLCRRKQEIRQRQSARSIKSFIVGQKLVRMVSCPGCGKNIGPTIG